MGDFSFAPDEEICAVVRRLAVTALGRGEIVARDWKTGDLLRGQLA